MLGAVVLAMLEYYVMFGPGWAGRSGLGLGSYTSSVLLWSHAVVPAHSSNSFAATLIIMGYTSF